jgi:mannose-6-phosphate isomerase-like protein (cupin superfamily)
MSHERVNYRDVEPLAPDMHFLRDELDCETVGFTVVDADGAWEGKEHDHAEDGHEEVYFLVDGAAELAVEGEALSLDPGDAVRVDGDATRRLTVGDDGATVVVAGAT